MAQRTTGMAATRTRTREEYLTGLQWHVGAFVILNAFFWILDLATGQGGINWAYWITGFWGFALAFHVLAYYVDGRQLEARKAAQYLAQNKHSETASR